MHLRVIVEVHRRLDFDQKEKLKEFAGSASRCDPDEPGIFERIKNWMNGNESGTDWAGRYSFVFLIFSLIFHHYKT
jgi:hypothetical protein